MKKGGERYVNWGREALDLYEKNLNKVGKIEYRGEFPYTLLPTFHSTATAQITVTIDEEGNFLHGEQVPAKAYLKLFNKLVFFIFSPTFFLIYTHITL